MIIISPAKKLNFTDLNLEVNFSNPSFIEKTKLLVKKLRKLDAKEIQSLMNISDKLSELNVQRYKDFSVTNEYVSERSKPAIFAFAGDTFNGTLASGINLGMNSLKAGKYANVAAAISVTKIGTSLIMPRQEEINSLFG